MIRSLLLVFFCLSVSVAAFAQDTNRHSPTRGTDLRNLPAIEALAPVLQLGGMEKSAVTDTILPLILSDACARELVFYFADTTRFGYLSGTNNFFDLEKLQRIELTEATNFTVNDIVAAFAVADDIIGDRKVVANLYEDGGSNNPLGTFLGSSDTLTVSQLALGGTYTSFPFSTPIALTNTSSFFVSIEFADLYFNDQDNVNYVGNVALFSTEIGCGDGENALEVFPDTSGNQYNTILANWGLNLEFAIGAIIDRDPFTSTRNPVADYATTISPNPATEVLTLAFAAATNHELTVSLLSMDGRILRSQVSPAGNGSVTWSVNELPAGVYLYQVAGAQGVQTGKVVIR
jgi:hypothetical protein